MSVSVGFIEQIKEHLAPLGHLTMRKMFGGAAVYCNGQVFALLMEDILYLKVDASTRGGFETEGCGPFQYMTKDGQHALISYYRAPDRLLDEPDELRTWAQTAITVGARTRGARKRPA
jgi:DNA transformation protein and related proteins